MLDRIVPPQSMEAHAAVKDLKQDPIRQVFSLCPFHAIGVAVWPFHAVQACKALLPCLLQLYFLRNYVQVVRLCLFATFGRQPPHTQARQQMHS